MIQYLEHDDFRGARKATMLISISVIIFNKLNLVGDQFVFFGMNVNFEHIDHHALATLAIVYFLFNLSIKLIPYVLITWSRIQEEYYKEAKYSREKLDIDRTNSGDFSNYDLTNEELEEVFINVEHKIRTRARISRTTKYASLFFIDIGVPYVLSATALLETSW